MLTVGAPLSVALSTGAAIEIANIGIKNATRRHSFHKLKRDHEFAYVLDAREWLDKE